LVDTLHRLAAPQAQLEPPSYTLDPKLMLNRAMLFSQTLLGLLEPEAIAQAALAVVRDFCRPDAISLLVRDREGIHLDLIAAEGWSQAHVGKLSLPLSPPDSSGVAWAVHTRKPVFKVHSSGGASKSLPVALQAGVKTSLLVPMLVPESHTSALPASTANEPVSAVGALVLDSLTYRTYLDHEVQFLSLIANQTASAFERAREHQSLRQAEARYRSLFDGVPLALYRTTPAGQILDANPACVHMLGYPDREVLLATNAIELWVRPEDRKRWQAELEHKTVVDSFEAQYRCYNGAVIWVREHARVVRDAHGQAVYYEGSLEDITERKRAEEALARRASEMAALYETSLEINAQQDLSSLLHAIVRRAAGLLGVQMGGLYLMQPDKNRLELVVSYNLPGNFLGLTLGLGEGLSGRVAQTGAPLMIEDYQHWEGRAASFSESPLRRVLGVPLKLGDRIIGVLNVTDDQKTDRFSDEEIRLVCLFADQAAIAVENARLLEHTQRLLVESQRRAVQQEALNAIISAVSVAQNLHDLLEVVLVHTLTALGLEMGIIWTADQITVRGLPPELSQIVTQHIEAIRRLLRDVFVVEDWQQVTHDNPKSVFGSIAARFGVRASLTVPILVEERQFGGLSLAVTQPHAWSREEIALVKAVAHQVGLAAERLFLLGKTQEQARQVRQIMDTVPDGVLLLDTDKRVLLANPAARALLTSLAGVDEGEILVTFGHWPVEELLKPPRRGSHHEVVAEGPLRKQIFEVAARPISEEAEPGGWVLVLRDVTEEREIQKHIQQQDRLAAVGHLAAGIAHDFNNILTSIVGFAELLQMRPDIPDRARDQIGVIAQQGKRASQLIRQILDFSRQSIAQRQPLDLIASVREATRFLERTIPENIRIVVEIEAGQYQVNANPMQMQQMVTNLVLNARDAMPEGGEIRLHATTLTLKAGDPAPLSDLPPGQWVVLTISDTGTGMTPAVLERIFEPFFTTKEPGKGTGLGLAQVYGIIQQHEGYIAVQSELGRGTKFSIYLPALIELEATVAEKGPEKIANGHGESILVVEDQPAVLEVTQALLQHLGYRVLTASTGTEALAVYARHHGEISLVLADMVMPGMGGVELYYALKEKNHAVKVILMTGYPLGEEAKALLAQGIVDWLQKPLNLRQLARVVSRNMPGSSN